MTVTKEDELQKIAKSKIRIKRFVNNEGDIVFKIQRKKWYGWTNIYDEYGFFWYKVYNSYSAAVKDAITEINREYNRLAAMKSKYYYYPF